jgi:hypothetical protein
MQAMLKGEDIVLLLSLTNPRPDWTLRSVEHDTTIPRMAVQRALKRLADAGLFDPRRRRTRVPQAEEFLIHGLRYVFPAHVGAESRGFATAWGVEPLRSALAAPGGDPSPVWPSAKGNTRGPALEPLHASAIEAAQRDPQLAEQLALVDGIRVGDSRLRGVSAALLKDRLDRVSG